VGHCATVLTVCDPSYGVSSGCGCVCCVLLCSIPYECVLHMGVCRMSVCRVCVSLCRIKSRCSWRSTRGLCRGCWYALYIRAVQSVAQSHQSTRELISFECASHHTGLWCVVEGGGGIRHHEAGVAQGADQYDECVHMCVFMCARNPGGLYHWI
jgi:hypothetical protein